MGRILTTDDEQAARWVEHFKSLLNQKPCLLNTVEPLREVADPARSLNNGKATVIDAIHDEMLKFELQTSLGVLCPFFDEV